MRRQVGAAARSSRVNVWRATLAGFCASFVGIGLARFAYTPLVPVLIAARWFEPAAAVYLGAANLAGYLAGALLARPMAARAPAARVLQAMMLLATAAFFACAWPLSFLWYFLWRFAAGLAGGALMALAAPAVLPQVPAARRGLAGGAVFTGVGLGIAASGTLVPLLLGAGLAATWCGLGALALVLTALAWRGWPEAAAAPRPATAWRPAPSGADAALPALYAEYALNAVGLVPHMVFLVDFIARGLGRGLAAGAQAWLLFGLGALIGPMLAGYAGDRLGFARALRLAFIVQAAAVALPAVATGTGALIISSLVAGAFVPGIVPLVLGRIHELIGEASARQRVWSIATGAFALGQAGAAYGFSFLFAQGGGYAPLFALGAAALLLALMLDLALGRAGAPSFPGGDPCPSPPR
jgi:predicted MFS family arabinose efflux permease